MDPPAPPRVNVADRLAEAARDRPDAIALATPAKRGGWQTITLGELDRDATQAARGLAARGVGPGKRIVLLVRPGAEFVTLVFALLRTGATMVLVDAGLGRKNIVRCLASTDPDGFVAIPIGQALRVLKRKQFANAKLNVTVGRRWFWGGETLASIKRIGSAHSSPSPTGEGARGGGAASPDVDCVHANAASDADSPNTLGSAGSVSPSPNASLQGRRIVELPYTAATDPAAIVFTSGSTGPPKGVLYTHETFVSQCAMIQQQYGIRPGDIDLACFPLFGLFNVACGVTVVLPEMDFSRPASCDPKKLIAAANQWKVTQAFASPAVWDRVSQHCETTGDSIPTLRKVLSCGAPVPAKVLRRTLACVHPEATMHTPYGATEALPIATIEAKEILGETAAKTDGGAGVCVGREFDSINWRIIPITDDPIATIDDTEDMPTGEIGELIVRGPQVSTMYVSGEPGASATGGNPHNAIAKIADGRAVWHRMGDVGYFDAEGRFWYCGRKSQRVVTSEGTLYTECVEPRVNAEPGIMRSALVGVPRGERDIPVLIYEDVHPWEGDPEAWSQSERAIEDLGLTHTITIIMRHIGPLPTDIRHNSKIRREELAVWAEEQLRKEGRL